MEFKEQLIQKNYTKGGNKPKYIVIHNTDNKTADAQQHWKFWNTNDKANSSAHYIVDDKEVIKLVKHEDIAWHCGKKYGSSTHADCTNSNSIGIEICNHDTCDFDKAMANAIELVKKIMSETGIGLDGVITHEMACAKKCPSTILKLNKWDWFKSKLVDTNEKEIYWRVVVASNKDIEVSKKLVEKLKLDGYKDAFIVKYEKG